MWNLVLGPIVSAVSGWFSDKAKIKQAQVDGKVKLLQSAANNVADWERMHVQGSMSSWKDEWIMFLYSIPIIMCFIGLSEEAKAGFAVLSELPDWYTGVFVAISLASFGIRATGTIKGLLSKG